MTASTRAAPLLTYHRFFHRHHSTFVFPASTLATSAFVPKIAYYHPRKINYNVVAIQRIDSPQSPLQISFVSSSSLKVDMCYHLNKTNFQKTNSCAPADGTMRYFGSDSRTTTTTGTLTTRSYSIEKKVKTASVIQSNQRSSISSHTTKSTRKNNGVKRKHLKKNQLGQKGQNRIQMKKEKKKKTKLMTTEQHKVNHNISQKRLKIAKPLHQRHKKEPNNNKFVNHQESRSTKQLASIPPALLLPTASPYVYVAKIACENSFQIDHRTLFQKTILLEQPPEDSNLHLSSPPNHRISKSYQPLIPRLFQKGYFEYFPNSVIETTKTTQQQLTPNNYQPKKKPEVAFLGRSNVGKSSLLNSLMRRALAVTSKQPGRTQQPNYYGLLLNESNASRTVDSIRKQLHTNFSTDVIGYMIDLAGYGYAVGPETKIDEWQKMTQEFLLHRRDRKTLRRVFLLQDSRTGALPLDLTVQNWIEDAEIPHTVVLTKADCVPRSSIVKHSNLACMRYHHKFQEKKQQQLYRTLYDSDYLADLNLERGYGRYYNDENERTSDADDDGHGSEGFACVDGLFMSPIIHATSAKANTGIAELLDTIQTEFLSAQEEL